jgi:hypothetical protein
MKTSKRLIGGVVIVLLALAVGYHRTRLSEPTPAEETSATEPPQASESGGSASPPKAPRRTPDIRSTPPAQESEQANQSGTRTETWVSQKNVPINFYGRALDEVGHPLAGVCVVLATRQWYPVARMDIDARFPETAIFSDEGGYFSLVGGTGDVLSIKALEKQGYEPEPGSARDFGYNVSENHNPNPNNPVIFKLWRAGTHQALVIGDKFYAIWPDGRTYTIDLLLGSKSESATSEGDLRVRVSRPSDVKFGQRYDWSLIVEAINGGIVEEPDTGSAMYIAPADGYVPKYELSFKSDDPNWTYRIKKRFYTQTRSGAAVGRITLDVFAFYDPNLHDGTLGIKYAINPSGSRILRP